jgi:hypothetical protein
MVWLGVRGLSGFREIVGLDGRVRIFDPAPQRIERENHRPEQNLDGTVDVPFRFPQPLTTELDVEELIVLVVMRGARLGLPSREVARVFTLGAGEFPVGEFAADAALRFPVLPAEPEMTAVSSDAIREARFAQHG